jgi:3-deoxy-manno-octulosonate cytidylyltransferase (CMP-KDO synthetase)
VKATKVLAVIPARLNSRRFPGKVLYSYKGRPLLYYVYRELSKARTVDRVIVATDNRRVHDAVVAFGGEAIMTSSRFRTGSDRVAAAARRTGGDIVINVQADNYGLRAASLDRVVKAMRSPPAPAVATLARRIQSDSELFNPHVVKLVTAGDGTALWFSRLPIPYLQNADEHDRSRQFRFLAHIGVYFFHRRALEQFSRWKRSPLEKAESLEQLRILENGGRIKVFRTSARTVSIDTPQDVKKLSTMYT